MSLKELLRYRCNRRRPNDSGRPKKKQCVCSIRRNCALRSRRVKRRHTKNGEIFLRKAMLCEPRLVGNAKSWKRSNSGRLKNSKGRGYHNNTKPNSRGKRFLFELIRILAVQLHCMLDYVGWMEPHFVHPSNV